MNLSTTILGTTTVRQLQETSSGWVLRVGSDRLTRAELAGVGCYNFLAARRLTEALRGFPIKSLSDLYARIPPGALALPQVGVISLAVLGAAFEAKGIGGDAPLENWVQKHASGNGRGEAHAMVTFFTLKRREQKLTPKGRRKRRAA